jgi:hypothetical protein
MLWGVRIPTVHREVIRTPCSSEAETLNRNTLNPYSSDLHCAGYKESAPPLGGGLLCWNSNRNCRGRPSSLDGWEAGHGH